MYCTKYHNFSDEELIVEAIVTRPNDDIVVELVERLRVLEAEFEFFRKKKKTDMRRIECSIKTHGLTNCLHVFSKLL